MTVHELEQVDVRNGCYPEWVRTSACWVWPWYEDQGVRVRAVWNTVVGPAPQATVLYEYPDAEALQATRLTLGRPGSRPAAVDAARRLTRGTRLRTLVPSPYWETKAIPRDGAFTFRTFQIEPGGLEEFQRLTAELIWPHGESHGLGTFIQCWGSAVDDEVVFISRYDDLAHWERTHPSAGVGRSEDVTEWWRKVDVRNHLIRESDVRVMLRIPAWPGA